MTSIYNIHTNLYKHTNIVTPNAVEPLIVNFQMSKLPLFSVLSACLLHKTKYCLLPLKLKKNPGLWTKNPGPKFSSIQRFYCNNLCNINSFCMSNYFIYFYRKWLEFEWIWLRLRLNSSHHSILIYYVSIMYFVNYNYCTLPLVVSFFKRSAR